MPKRVAFVEAEINRRLAAAVAPALPELDAAFLRRSARYEHLSERDDLLAVYPEDAHLPHWFVRAARDLVAGLIFRADRLEFFYCLGQPFELVAVCQECPDDDPDQLLERLATICHFPEPPLHIERQAAALWLGRGWQPRGASSNDDPVQMP